MNIVPAVLWVISALTMVGLYVWTRLRLRSEARRRGQPAGPLLLIGVLGIPLLGVATANSKLALSREDFFLLPALVNVGFLWLTRFDPYRVLSGVNPKPGSWLEKTEKMAIKAFILEVAIVVLCLGALGYFLS